MAINPPKRFLTATDVGDIIIALRDADIDALVADIDLVHEIGAVRGPNGEEPRSRREQLILHVLEEQRVTELEILLLNDFFDAQLMLFLSEIARKAGETRCSSDPDAYFWNERFIEDDREDALRDCVDANESIRTYAQMIANSEGQKPGAESTP